MSEATWKALSHALTLLRTEISQTKHLRAIAVQARREPLLREIEALQGHEKELMWLVSLYRPRSPEEVRESLARSIYVNMPIPDKPEWVPGGTSELQEIARAAAEKTVETLRQQGATSEQGVR